MSETPVMRESKSYRTLVLWLLTVVYIFSFIDRQIIGILSPAIKAEMGFSDFQLGLLKGFAFALLYTAVGIPIAWLADRYSRIRIVTISLTCLLYTSPSPRDKRQSRMPSSA